MNPSSSHSTRAVQVREWLRFLSESQWWPAEQMTAWQMERFSALLAHAAKTSRYYRQRLGTWEEGAREPLTPERVRELPILTRADIQAAGARLNSASPPRDHGWTATVQTSGSTGQPVSVLTSQWAQTVWTAISVRDHLWHDRDFSLRHAEIGYFPRNPAARTPDGGETEGWTGSQKSGPSYIMDSIIPIEQQLDWLHRIRPAYLLSYPTNLVALADMSAAQGRPLDSLVQARSKGESLSQEQRARVRELWGVEIRDMYSSQEVGYIALQAPGAEDYLVQSEAVYLEVLDDAGAPCPPGAVGRVVVTALQNFATPLIRYEVGDYAEVGPPSPCGRGLPALRRILGRVRNMLVRPDGSRIWPEIGNDSIANVAPVKQYQLVQTDLRRLEARIVRRAPFTFLDQMALTKHIQDKVGPEFDIVIRYVDEIERSPSGKYEDFRSEIAGGPEDQPGGPSSSLIPRSRA